MIKKLFDDLELEKLNKQQLNRFGKYLTATYLSGIGLNVLPNEDGNTYPFKVRLNSKKAIHVYVRTARLKKSISYSFILKKTWNNVLSKDVFVALLLIESKVLDLYLVPATVWKKPNALFVDRNYDKEGQVSAPEWGISTNQKNIDLLKEFAINKQLELATAI